jgi:hypothetical protein
VNLFRLVSSSSGSGKYSRKCFRTPGECTCNRTMWKVEQKIVSLLGLYWFGVCSLIIVPMSPGSESSVQVSVFCYGLVYWTWRGNPPHCTEIPDLGNCSSCLLKATSMHPAYAEPRCMLGGSIRCQGTRGKH